MPTDHILILGGDLIDAKTLGPMTLARVHTAVAYAKKRNEVKLYAAAGYFEDFPDMEVSMAALMAEEAKRTGVEVRLIGPSCDFNTRGELRVFMQAIPQGEPKKIVSTWWHLPRVKRIAALEWGRQVSKSFGTVPAEGDLTPRLAVLEALKWCFTFVPERMRKPAVSAFRLIFGRSSW